MMNVYFAFCEDLFSRWLKDDASLQVFRGQFDVDFLPEPYLIFKKGKNELIALNNNPGETILEVQARSVIKQKYPGKSYSEIADGMVSYYRSPKFERPDCHAYHRNMKMLQFAEWIGCDGMVNVETFFLHSNGMNKYYFLNNYRDNSLVRDYVEAMKAYLEDKPVLVISAVGSGRSITKEALSQVLSDWNKYQCEIIGMDIDKVKVIPITRKNEKVTSAILVENNKYFVLKMGSNDLPVISDEIRRQLKQG